MTAKDPRKPEVASRMRGLLAHPGWTDLDAEVGAAATAWADSLARELLLAPLGTYPEQAQLDFWRGHWAGAKWALSRPVKAQAQLEALDKETS